MRKAWKIVGAIAAVIAVVMVALVVLVRIFVTPERIRALVLPKVEAALHRPVSLEKIDVSLFSGIILGNLVVKERAGDETFVAADRVLLRYQLWPLLFRRVIVDEVRLERPRIRVERLPDGTFNFSDLIASEETKEAAAPTAETTAGTSVDLLVSEVNLDEGEILFIDHAVSASAPFRLQVTGLEMSARDISLRKAFPFRVGARLGEGTLVAEGKVDPQKREGSLQTEIARLDLALFTPYFQDKFPGRVNALPLTLRITAEGGKQAVRSQGQITVEPVDLLLAREGKEPLPFRNVSLSLDYALGVNPGAGTIDVEKATIAFNRIPLQISGRVEHYREAPNVNLQLSLPAVNVATAFAALPPELVGPAAAMHPAGQVSARALLAGPTAEPKRLLREGEVQFSPLEATVGGARIALSGRLLLSGDTVVSENLKAAMGENQADVDLRAENLLGDIIRVRSSVRAARFALDPLLQASAAPAVAGSKAETKRAEPVDLPVLADGSVQVGETVYKGLSVRDFDLRYRLEKNVLTVQRLDGKVAGGTFAVTGAVDLGKTLPVYNSRIILQGIQADPLVTAFWPKAAGTVAGTLNSQLTMDGKGTEPEIMKRNLSARGEVVIANGQLTGAGLVQGLAGFLNLDELRVLRFSQAKGAFTVRNGVAQVNSDIQGRDVRLHPQGTVNLDGYYLDLDLNLRIAPELARRVNLGKVGRLLSDDQGWTRVPLKVAGTVEKPRFFLATAGLREEAGEALRQRLEKELQRRLPSGTPQEAPAPEGERRGIEEKLRGLFGN